MWLKNAGVAIPACSVEEPKPPLRLSEKRNIPDSRIAGLSLARNDPAFLEECLKAMGDDVKLFDWIIYHGYAPAPESSYANVERQKAVLAKYNPAAKLRQGDTISEIIDKGGYF